MAKYLVFRFKTKRICYLLIIPIICFFSLHVSRIFDPNYVSINDLLVIITDNRIFMATIFTILPFILFFDSGRLKAYHIQCINKLESIKKWFLAETSFIVCSVLLFIILFFTIFFVTASAYNFEFINNWSDSFYAKYDVMNPDSFCMIGNPCALLIQNNVSTITSTVVCVIFIFLRVLFYGLFYLTICLYSQKNWLGVCVFILIDWIEIYLYHILDRTKPLFILPCEHSVITNINGYRASFTMSIIYWILIIVLLIGINILYCEKGINKYISSQNKTQK